MGALGSQTLPKSLLVTDSPPPHHITEWRLLGKEATGVREECNVAFGQESNSDFGKT